MEEQQINSMINELKEIKKQQKRRSSLSERGCNLDLSPKQMDKINTDITYCGHYIEEAKFRLHTLIVKNKLANPYNNEYYQDDWFEPSAFHKYKLKRPHPLTNPNTQEI